MCNLETNQVACRVNEVNQVACQHMHNPYKRYVRVILILSFIAHPVMHHVILIFPSEGKQVLVTTFKLL